LNEAAHQYSWFSNTTRTVVDESEFWHSLLPNPV
jgi:hypothetical protein